MAGLPAWMMPHTVQVEPLLGTSPYGSGYGSAVTVRCFLDRKQRLLRDGNGDQVIADATAYCALDTASMFPINSRVTLPGESVAYVIETHALDDGGLGAWQHLEVSISGTKAGPVFPDAATLTRYTPGVMDPVTGVIPEIPELLWTGSCLIEVEPSADAAQSELLDRRRELVLYTIKLPLEVADIKQDDRFNVTTSRDPRLVDRTLHVIRVFAASHAQERVVLAAERQV